MPPPRPKHSLLRALTLTLLFGLTLSACGAAQTKRRLDRQFGKPNVRERTVSASDPRGAAYWHQVRPILENRCVVCHGCYDAPCQLKLGAIEGIERGSSKELIYDPSRLLAMNLTRLFEDAETVEEWRKMGFHPVLNERSNDPQANLEGSVLYQMLALKKEHPLPNETILPDFDFSLDRKQVCPTVEEFSKYKKEHPTWGMPYGLPGLSEQEFRTILSWLEDGAVYTQRSKPQQKQRAAIDHWEAFLNGNSDKERLVSRYLYEHWFLAHLHFEDSVTGQGAPAYFELVRSKTPPGTPVERISTRRPFDAPGAEEFYYRFLPLLTPVLVKTHLVYPLTATKMERLKELFFVPEYEVAKLPDYDPVSSANPFATFLQLPVRSRYQFLLDDSRYVLDGFIKGPVCRGQTSLDVINDRFWVYFADPDRTATHAEAEFLAKELPKLNLPAGEQSNALVLENWLKYSGKEKKYLKSKIAALNARFGTAEPLTLDMLWDGDEKNPNAALTVFRHDDSATVVQGLVGPPPKTSWVLGYGLLERIHYLLVAGFDVYGNVGHQLVTRLYMDFLRMEAEFNFLAFLPRKSRNALRDHWYEGAEKEAAKYINSTEATFFGETGIQFETMNPELEFYEMSEAYLEPALSKSYDFGAADSEAVKQAAQQLGRLVGGPVQFIPQMSFLRVRRKDSNLRFYTLLRDNAHSNILSIFSESSTRRPELDELVLVPGLLGAYPNAFFHIEEEQLLEFARKVSLLGSEADYTELRDLFGIRRGDSRFWKYADRLHRDAPLYDGQVAGLFDFNRLENR